MNPEDLFPKTESVEEKEFFSKRAFETRLQEFADQVRNFPMDEKALLTNTEQQNLEIWLLQ